MSVLMDWGTAAELGPAEAGGKGFQIGLLDNLGIPVPPGFVVGAGALGGYSEAMGMPDGVLDAVEAELGNRGWLDRPLAIRSSAAMEDSATASFAGIHASVLNVSGIADVAAAIGAVCRSASTPEAVAYRRRMNIADSDRQMAVVVMPLLPAVASGVAFTCDPISGRSDRVVIHAQWGLGETVVGGSVDPDEYTLGHEQLFGEATLLASRIGRKERISVAREGGGTALRELAPEKRSEPVLNSALATRLARLVLDAASALDYADPCYDIEWVWDGEQFWIVQARKITVRHRETYPALENQPAYWSRSNYRDVAPDPLSALEWNIYRTLLPRMSTCTLRLGKYPLIPHLQRVALRHGRLYLESSIFQWENFDAYGVLPKATTAMAGGHQPEIEVPEAGGGEKLSRGLRGAAFLLRSAGPRRRAAATFERARRLAADWDSVPSERGSLATRLRQQVETLCTADDLALLQLSGSFLFILLETLEKQFPGEGQALTAALLSGGEPTVTAAQNLAMIALAETARSDTAALEWLRSPDRIDSEWAGALPESSAFRAAFAAFVERYGHRGVYESYLRNPRWREAPGYLFRCVLDLLDADSLSLGDRRRDAAGEAWSRIQAGVPFGQRGLVRTLVRLATSERNFREGARSAMVGYLGGIRRTALALGASLAADTPIFAADDVFHLTLDEIDAGARNRISVPDLARRAARRRAQLETWSAAVPEELVIDGAVADTAAALVSAQSGESREWRGTAAGIGLAQGVAFVARTPEEGLGMAHGSILVSPSTDPSWTPLFLKAGAVVMETGGFLSHGAIVARELGIPAVVNIPGVLDQISTGDRLHVDAARGIVTRL